MINDDNSDTFYYLYRHIRLDNNVPFYIGIGTYNDRYKRVSTVAKGKAKQHKGYIFKYATDTTPIEEFKNKNQYDDIYQTSLTIYK